MAPVGEGQGIVGLEPDGFVEILQRALQVAFGATRKAPVTKGLCQIRLKPDGLGVKAQLFINVGGSKPSLEPLLGSQFFVLNRRSRLSRSPLFCSGSLCGERGRVQHRSQRHIQVPAAQAVHGLHKVLWRDAESVVALECSECASELVGDCRRTEVEPFQHQRHNIALVRQSSLDLATQPICRVVATLQRGGGEQDKEVRPRSYVCEYDALEVATGDTVVIEEDIKAVLSQVLKNSECPGNIGAAITEKNGFLDAFHTPA